MRFHFIVLCTLLLPAILLLNACGFQPVYGSHHSHIENGIVVDGLGAVHIATIPDRSGQILRQELQQRFYTGPRAETPRYELRVKLRENKIDLGVRKDAVVTRAQYRFQATYSLVNAQNGQLIRNGHSRATASYNILDNEFATDISAKDARERGLTLIADEITTQISLQLKAQTSS